MIVIVMMVATLVDRWPMYRHDMAQNTWIDFYGQVVDAAGQPVQGASVVGVVVGYNELYLFGGERERRHAVRAVTDTRGRFSWRHRYGDTLGIESVDKEGYRWLYGEQSETDDNISFSYHPAGYLYVPDPDRPAVFPLVKPGERATALPSRGGWQRDYHGKLTPNRPVVPGTPSVPQAVPSQRK